jgi:hypothetical protein
VGFKPTRLLIGHDVVWCFCCTFGVSADFDLIQIIDRIAVALKILCCRGSR